MISPQGRPRFLASTRQATPRLITGRCDRCSAQIRERFAARFQEPNLKARLINRIVAGNVVIDHEQVTRTFSEGTGKIELVAIYEVQDARIAKAWFILGMKTIDPPC